MKAAVNGIELEYAVDGPGGGVPMLLCTGISVQLIWWWDEFVAKLVDRGYRVVRFDNRDAGQSTHFSHMDLAASMNAAFADGEAPYTLSDIAGDAVGLLDHLGIPKAHLVGQSMGGMTVQTIALEHPARVLSVCSIGSTTGDPDVGQPDPAGLAGLMQGNTPPADREEAADRYLQTWKLLAGPRYPCDEARTRAVGLRAYDREHGSIGVIRHLAAIRASGDRTPRLAEIKVPVLVIHGSNDPLVTVSGGYATAKAIPNSELHIVEGMGHDIPPPLWDEFTDLIHQNATREI
ncbi:MAG TPA: alpha/beta hydrolase [Acidimicrobiales bacterium]|nr:alpha/beta hydrolase [Acidimicrobiales bacterium]